MYISLTSGNALEKLTMLPALYVNHIPIDVVSQEELSLNTSVRYLTFYTRALRYALTCSVPYSSQLPNDSILPAIRLLLEATGTPNPMDKLQDTKEEDIEKRENGGENDADQGPSSFRFDGVTSTFVLCCTRKRGLTRLDCLVYTFDTALSAKQFYTKLHQPKVQTQIQEEFPEWEVVDSPCDMQQYLLQPPHVH